MQSTHSLTDFENHPLQSIMALFLTKRDLYKEHNSEKDKQGYFFYRFRLFAANYHNFDNSDASVYFMSLYKYRAGEYDVCGGCKMTSSAARYFKARHASAEAERAKIIDAFSKKYRTTFNQKGVEDPRLFLGVTQIWNKLDRAEEIVTKSQWPDIRTRSYNDHTFKTPFPEKLEKHLIPLTMRNRALQKYKNEQMSKSDKIYLPTRPRGEEDEEPQTPSVPISNPVAFIRPSECDDDDWL